jgi:hypothetical protein
MATVGQTLPAPETGWRRIEQTDANMVYTGTWTFDPTVSTSGGSHKVSSDALASVKFNFTGSKFRLICTRYTYSPVTTLKIDGIAVATINLSGALQFQTLFYDTSSLSSGNHFVEFINGSAVGIAFDAIDISSDAYIRPYNENPKQKICKTIEEMTIGDIIPCKYTATSGTAGTFSELGTCVAEEIPYSGSATPNGLFYFIKSGKGLLIADRVVQTNISWNTLNAAKYIEGVSTVYINPAVVSTNVSTSLLNTPEYLPNLFVPSLLNNVNFYFDTAPPALVYIQFEYPESHLLTSIQVFASNNAAGMEPLAKFSIKGSISGDFTDEELIYSSTYTAYGGWQTFSVPSIKKFKKFRFYADTWAIDNGGGGANIKGITPYFSDYKLRSLSGGNAYLETDGKASLADRNLGAFPNNEWDKYIVKSDLDGKIIAGSDNVWHNSASQSWCQDTTNLSIYNLSPVRTTRGYSKINGFTYNSVTNLNGFRPVLEYQDSPKSRNIWY